MPYDILQSSTQAPLLFFMTDSADHISGKTGLTPTVTIRKPGGAFGSPAGSVTEIANGWYQVAGNATDTNTLGPLALHATGTGADPCDMIVANVIAYNPQDAVRLGLSALPNAAAAAAGGLVINGANTGPLSISGGVTFSNSGGDAFICSSSGGNGNGINATGNGNGHGISATGGTSAGSGLNCVAGVGSASAGIRGSGDGAGDGMLIIAGATGDGLEVRGGATSGDGFKIGAQGAGHGLISTGVGAGSHGIRARGGNAVTTSAAGDGISSQGGTATTSSGGTAGIGLNVLGGSGAASTNGAAVGALFAGGGTNTVASAAHGLSLTGTSIGSGMSAVSGAGATGNGITATAASTNGSGVSATGTGAGSGLLANTLSVTGAVAFGSTLTVTGTTSLAALTTSGTVTFNAFTVTNALTVSGATTLTGVVTATNAGNDIRGVTASVTGTVTIDAASVDAIWDEDATGHQTQGSFGQTIGDSGATATSIWSLTNTNLDATVSSRAPSATALSTATWTNGLATNLGTTNTTVAANLDAAVSSRMATYTQPTGFLAATFPTTVASTTNITAGTITTVSGNVNGSVGSVAGNVSGNVVGSVGSVTGDIGGLAAGAVTDVENAVWDAVLANHLDAGSTGFALNAAGGAGDPWGTALPGVYGAGTAGFILGTNLNATVSSRASQTSVDDLPTNAEFAAAIALLATNAQLVKVLAAVYDTATGSGGNVLTLSNGATQTINLTTGTRTTAGP